MLPFQIRVHAAAYLQRKMPQPHQKSYLPVATLLKLEVQTHKEDMIIAMLANTNVSERCTTRRLCWFERAEFLITSPRKKSRAHAVRSTYAASAGGRGRGVVRLNDLGLARPSLGSALRHRQRNYTCAHESARAEHRHRHSIIVIIVRTRTMCRVPVENYNDVVHKI